MPNHGVGRAGEKMLAWIQGKTEAGAPAVAASISLCRPSASAVARARLPATGADLAAAAPASERWVRSPREQASFGCAVVPCNVWWDPP